MTTGSTLACGMEPCAVLPNAAISSQKAPFSATSRPRLVGSATMALPRLSKKRAESSGGYVPYRSSKAALNMAWHSLAIEAKRLGIVAAVLDPGWVKTRMGGPSAPTPPEHSVGEMRRLIERLGPADSGGFFKRDGSRHQW